MWEYLGCWSVLLTVKQKYCFRKCIIPHWAHSSPCARFGRVFFFLDLGDDPISTNWCSQSGVKVREKVHRETQMKWEWGRQRGPSGGGGRGRLESGEKAAVPLRGLFGSLKLLTVFEGEPTGICAAQIFFFFKRRGDSLLPFQSHPCVLKV